MCFYLSQSKFDLILNYNTSHFISFYSNKSKSLYSFSLFLSLSLFFKRVVLSVIFLFSSQRNTTAKHIKKIHIKKEDEI